MENKCQKALIMATFFSVVIAVTLAIKPCTDRVENEICGQAGPMTKRCRKVKPDCVGATCRLICVPETRGNPATIDWCSPNPCLHGTCVNQQGGYTCHCELGWSGDNCEVPPIDWCSPNPCLHGTCGNQQGGYTCHCELGWSGDNCDVPDCSDGSPLFCNCVDDCPGGMDEAICDCSVNGYSDEFVTIDASYMDGFFAYLITATTPEACKANCTLYEPCPGANFNTISNDCYLIYYSPLGDPSNYITGQPTWQLFVRKCLCI